MARMTISGNLRKMHAELGDPVQYSLVLDDRLIGLNPAINQTLTLSYTGEINCIQCGRKTSKSFSQGFCYPCFRKLAQCDSCIVSPEKCHYDEGTCREPEWGEQHCFQPHYVYLANSSGVKVGITRGTQIPTRWIDQGATAAMPVFRVANRKLSGLVEVAFKDHVTDKTSWQKMLKGVAAEADLEQYRDQILAELGETLQQLRAEHGEDAIELLPDAQTQSIHFPVETYPTKVKSFNFDKTPVVSGVLHGIKGQYLIFDSGVINIRKFGGYKVSVECAALSED
ncbi:MAG: DUF2797 domain-containing protein [bacterium]